MNKKRRVIFYYDGFNFYRGLKSVEWKDCYWLDLFKFSQNLINNWDGYEIIHINYFTAKSKSHLKRLRQNIWLGANTKLHDNIEIHYGKYKPEIIFCPNPKCRTRIEIPKEKQTDVNIALELVHNCVKDNCDVSVLISGDNDLLPPVRYINKYYPDHRIHIYYPPNRNKSNLHDYSFTKPIHLKFSKEVLLRSKLDKHYKFDDGSISIIPPEWDI